MLRVLLPRRKEKNKRLKEVTLSKRIQGFKGDEGSVAGGTADDKWRSVDSESLE